MNFNIVNGVFGAYSTEDYKRLINYAINLLHQSLRFLLPILKSMLITLFCVVVIFLLYLLFGIEKSPNLLHEIIDTLSKPIKLKLFIFSAIAGLVISPFLAWKMKQNDQNKQRTSRHSFGTLTCILAIPISMLFLVMTMYSSEQLNILLFPLTFILTVAEINRLLDLLT